jgi:hypothetical protein
LNYRIFKENFEFENYFRILENKDIYTLCKFRTTNHKLSIETGRWNNIDSVNRICTKCDNITIGDEYHYIMEINVNIFQTLEIGSLLQIYEKDQIFLNLNKP